MVSIPCSDSSGRTAYLAQETPSLVEADGDYHNLFGAPQSFTGCHRRRVRSMRLAGMLLLDRCGTPITTCPFQLTSSLIAVGLLVAPTGSLDVLAPISLAQIVTDTTTDNFAVSAYLSVRHQASYSTMHPGSIPVISRRHHRLQGNVHGPEHKQDTQYW